MQNHDSAIVSRPFNQAKTRVNKKASAAFDSEKTSDDWEAFSPSHRCQILSPNFKKVYSYPQAVGGSLESPSFIESVLPDLHNSPKTGEGKSQNYYNQYSIQASSVQDWIPGWHIRGLFILCDAPRGPCCSMTSQWREWKAAALVICVLSNPAPWS